MKTKPISCGAFIVLLGLNFTALSGFGQQWLLAGNNVGAADFLGSINNSAIQFRVNNNPRMFISNTTSFAGVGPLNAATPPRSTWHVHSLINDMNLQPVATFQLTNSLSTAGNNRGMLATLTGNSGTLVNREGRLGLFGANGIQLGGLLNTPHLSIPVNGNVGIGTSGPLQRLHVHGGFQLLDGANAALLLGSASTGNFGEYGIEYDVSTDPNNTVFGMNFFKPGGSQGGSGFQNFILYLNDYGNIGMGVLPSHIDNAFKLSVNGTIRANELVVETGWADHVFDSGYSLMSLDDVQAFIAANGHLPGVPSAEEVAACGAPLGETQTMLLEKVEELTLYIIELNARIAELESRQVAAPVTGDGR